MPPFLELDIWVSGAVTWRMCPACSHLMVVVPDDCDEEHLDPLMAFETGNQAQVSADIIPVSLEVVLTYQGQPHPPRHDDAEGRLACARALTS
jgi:hypothetical protein